MRQPRPPGTTLHEPIPAVPTPGHTGGVPGNQPTPPGSALALQSSFKVPQKQYLKNAPQPGPLSANELGPHSANESLQFLLARGLSPSLLTGTALPQSADITRERWEFLEALGLAPADVIAKHPALIGCSIAKNYVPVLDFLERVPITKQDLPGFLSAYPQVLCASVVGNLIPALDFLQGLDVPKEDTGKVLVEFPQLLGLPLEGTMSTSVAYLGGIGVHPRSIGPMLARYPRLLGMSVGDDILPKVEFLRYTLGMPLEHVAELVQQHPHVLGYELEGQFKGSVAALAEEGVGIEEVANVVLRFPDVLGLDVRQAWGPRKEWLVTKVGVDALLVPGMLSAMPQLLVLDLAKANNKVAFLNNWGFSQSHVATILTQCPHVLGLHASNSIGKKLSFLLHECERDVTEVADFPGCLLMPLAVLRERQQKVNEAFLSQSLVWMLDCSDEAFGLRVSIEKERLQH